MVEFLHMVFNTTECLALDRYCTFGVSAYFNNYLYTARSQLVLVGTDWGPGCRKASQRWAQCNHPT